MIVLDKDLKCSRERLESELNSHESIIQEQKNHIEILESALANIQLKNIHLEDEVIFILIFGKSKNFERHY